MDVSCWRSCRHPQAQVSEAAGRRPRRQHLENEDGDSLAALGVVASLHLLHREALGLDHAAKLGRGVGQVEVKLGG